MKKNLVFTNGCFDVLHRGHIELLRFCKSLGPVFVGLNSDESIRRLKGDSRPWNTQEDRKILLESLVFVDHVEVFEEDTPIDLIRTVAPAMIVKGGDYSSAEVVGRGLARVEVFPFVAGYSSSKLIAKLSEID